MKNNHFTVYYLPYAPLREELKVGEFTFVPYFNCGDRFKDLPFKTELDTVLGSYYSRQYGKDYPLRPLRSATLIMDEAGTFKELSEEKIKQLQRAVTILAYSCLPEHKIDYFSSDNFALIGQGLKPGQKTMTIQSGRIERMNTKLDSPSIKPDYINIPSMAVTPDKKVLRSLDKLLITKTDDVLANRIIRAIEWYVQAHYELTDVPYHVKIVMMATAFEILFDLGMQEKDKMEKFMQKALELTQDIWQQKVKIKLPKDNVKTEHLIQEKWACRFYTLRNDIVHGNSIRDSRYYFDRAKKSLHLDIADIVFQLCLIRLLAEKNYYEWNEMEPLFALIHFAKAFDPNKPIEEAP